MNAKTTPQNPFHPFGDDVRVACIDGELFANHADICSKYGVDAKETSKLPFPNGSIAMLATPQCQRPSNLYIGEAAYPILMSRIDGVCHE